MSYIYKNGALHFPRQATQNKKIHSQKNFLYFQKWNFLQNPPQKISYSSENGDPDKTFLIFRETKVPNFFYISGNGTFRAQKMKTKPKMLVILWEMEISGSKVGKKNLHFSYFL